MSTPTVVVTLRAGDAMRRAIDEILHDFCSVVYFADHPRGQRAAVLDSAIALMANNLAVELRPEQLQRLAGARLIQLLTSGVDHAPFSQLPPGVPVAHVPGAFSEPMAEHALAMALAAVKRLTIEDQNMRKGEFNQFELNRMLKGGTCAIVGFGGAGRAAAKRFRSMGMRIHAINRSGKTKESVDFIGTLSDLEKVLNTADVLLICLPLTRSTEGLIGECELSVMKKDAILVNISRGEIIDERALYGHLKQHPAFTACIEAWWLEPVRHGEFRTNYPFLELPNVIAAPHNSASVHGWDVRAARCGAQNVLTVLKGGKPRFMVKSDYRLR